MTVQKMDPPDPGNFKDIDVELLNFKEDISLEIDNYRKEMSVELGNARSRLEEMESNTLREAEEEWQKYEKKLADNRISILNEARNRVDEIKNRVHEETVVKKMLQDALKEVLYSFGGENKF